MSKRFTNKLKDNTNELRLRYEDDREYYIMKANDDYYIGGEAIDKLAHYEDMEEQGRLIELPCKWGETVYQIVKCDDGITKIFEMKVCATAPCGQLYGNTIWNFYLEDKYSKSYCRYFDFGRTVFHTREEAEEKLKELRGE